MVSVKTRDDWACILSDTANGLAEARQALLLQQHEIMRMTDRMQVLEEWLKGVVAEHFDGDC